MYDNTILLTFKMLFYNNHRRTRCLLNKLDRFARYSNHDKVQQGVTGFAHDTMFFFVLNLIDYLKKKKNSTSNEKKVPGTLRVMYRPHRATSAPVQLFTRPFSFQVLKI